MFPTHPFSGVTVPVSGFLIVTRRLRDCVKSRNREGKGERHIRSAFGASATPRQPLSGGYATLLLFARQSVAYPYAPAFQGCRQVVGYFAAKSAVRFNRLLAFLRVDAFLFFRLYNLLFPETVVVAVCLYGYVLPAESASLFFRCSLSFYRAVTFFDTWNIVCFILRLHFFKRNCRGFFRCVDRRLTIFSECAMLAV